MNAFPRLIIAVVFSVGLSCSLNLPVHAASSSPKLAAYYDDFMAICNGRVYQWQESEKPQASLSGIRQVGIGKKNRYALTDDDELLSWRDDPANPIVLMDDVQSFHAGRTGLLVIRNDNSLWQINSKSLLGFGEDVSEKPELLAPAASTASVGDSANYFVDDRGDLFVQGLAHRGQYGDGKLSATDDYVKTAADVVQVVSHTGHALILKRDGGVWGTGGNIYGPLGRHGYGDKAIRWGLIFSDATAIATGSSHSLAIRQDGSLWIWGRNEGLDAKKVMSNVSAVAAGNSSSIALRESSLWQWRTGQKPQKILNCD